MGTHVGAGLDQSHRGEGEGALRAREGGAERILVLWTSHKAKKEGEIILSQDEFAREVQPLIIKPEKKKLN